MITDHLYSTCCSYVFPAITLSCITLEDAAGNIFKSKKDTKSGRCAQFYFKPKKGGKSVFRYMDNLKENLPKNVICFL